MLTKPLPKTIDECLAEIERRSQYLSYPEQERMNYLTNKIRQEVEELRKATK